MAKCVEERIDECVLRSFGHVERMEDEKIAKRVCVGECAGNRSVGRPRKRWIDTVKEYLKKKGLNVRQVGKMVHDRSVWWLFARENALGVGRMVNT